MLGKLLKNELKHSGRYVATIYSVTAAVIAFMVIGILTKITWIGVLCSVLLNFVAIGVLLITLIAVIKNFYESLYTNLGYLSFTLPVKCSSLLLSKVIISFFWIILSYVIAGLCVFMVGLNAKTQAGEQFSGLFDLLDVSGLKEMIPSGATIAAVVAFAVVMILMHILTLVGFIYFSVTIANTRPLQGHPLLFGLLTFLGSYGVGYAISTKLTYSLPLSVYVTTEKIGLAFEKMSFGGEDHLFSFGLGGTIFIALAALGLLFLTGWIMEHKVNIK